MPWRSSRTSATPRGFAPVGKTRVCGGTCHKAKGAKCRCWCGGVLHGGAGASAREAFAREFGLEEIPTTEAKFAEETSQQNLFAGRDSGERWRLAIQAAVKARAEDQDARAQLRRDRVSCRDSSDRALLRATRSDAAV